MSAGQKVTTVATRLQEAMRIANKRQTDLVNETGIAKGTISNYINGKYEPKSPTLQRLARALNVSEMWLDGYDVPMVRTTVNAKVNKAIAKNIQMLREQAGMTQIEFANLLGVSETIAIEIENGKHTPNKEMVFRICDIFQTTPDFLDGTIVELLENGDHDAEYRYLRQQQPASDNLTKDEQILIDLFRRVPQDQQQFLMNMIRGALGSQE